MIEKLADLADIDPLKLSKLSFCNHPCQLSRHKDGGFESCVHEFLVKHPLFIIIN